MQIDSTRLVALLGPTNTGKTHRAVERMLTHRSGMLGLPLRLLAREIYDRVSLRIGEASVALVTGEEKRVPARPSYWICTVEAMPIDREVDFLAVDEIQLCAHRERGHVFTDRLLHARGRLETWFLGASTMRPLVSELLPTAELRSHARLSTLKHSGSQRLGELRPRTAVVAFSMAKVYAHAERMRVRRGGAAVVLGALSPRARNAQVALYQAGEVDYLVATDAIGMGLNLDIDHVAFTELSKFDGHDMRGLEPAELAQVAGRAGRHVNDGTFGTLAPVPTLPARVVNDIEGHRFPPLKRLMWRNADLDLSSPDALLGSLRQSSTRRVLELTRTGDVLEALVQLAADHEVRDRVGRSSDATALLWDVCRIPDYRQLMLEDHVTRLKTLFLQLTGATAELDPEWIAHRIEALDDPSGDVDDLLMRLAFIRTWTYITHRSAWLADAAGWQERTRTIEDRLSDALHRALLERFVDASATRPPLRRVKAADERDVLRDASAFQVLESMRDATAFDAEDPAAVEAKLVQELIDAPFDGFRCDTHGGIWHDERHVAKMTRGVDLQHPEVVLDPGLASDSNGARSRVQRRLVAWTRDLVSAVLAPLMTSGDGDAPVLSPAARGLAYQLERGLGTVAVRRARDQLRALTKQDREALRASDVQLGRLHLFVRGSLSAISITRRAGLCAAYFGAASAERVPSPSAVSFRVAESSDHDNDEAIYIALGFPAVGPRAIRADILERVGGMLRGEASRGPFKPSGRIGALLAFCPRAELERVIVALGYRRTQDGKFERGRGAKPTRVPTETPMKTPSGGSESEPARTRNKRRKRRRPRPDQG